MHLIAAPAPHFTARAVINGKIDPHFSLTNFQNQYVIFFFYPLNFTFVCPTELHAFQEALPQFKKRNAQIVACSVDSPYCHLAWLQTPKAKGGIAGITYPLVSDINKTIARSYGLLKEEEGVAYRGLFLIDKEGIIRHLLVNDLNLGRSCSEALRVLDALIYSEKNGEVCPANWQPGDKAMRADQPGLLAFFNETDLNL